MYLSRGFWAMCTASWLTTAAYTLIWWASTWAGITHKLIVSHPAKSGDAKGVIVMSNRII